MTILYTISVDGRGIDSYSVLAAFGNSDDVSENSTKYGGNASNGRVLSVGDKSEIHTKLNIIETNNYTIGVRVKTCDTCTFLKMGLEPAANSNITTRHLPSGNFSLKSNTTGLKWLYSTSAFGLTKGLYDLKIYSDSQTDIDAIAVYPIEKINPYGKPDNLLENQTIENAFNVEPNSSPSAQIVKYQKINPTKYNVKIHNATRPFMISFAESYDPLWEARIDTVDGSTSSNSSNKSLNNEFRTSSTPLYGLTNGFYVNKTGNYDLTIEYKPQAWFKDGLIISIISLVAILIIIFLSSKPGMNILRAEKRRVS